MKELEEMTKERDKKAIEAEKATDKLRMTEKRTQVLE